MGIRITTNNVESLKPGTHFDAVCPGLVLRVGVQRRSWQLRSRINGSYAQAKLGIYPEMGIADARTACRNMLDRLERGLPARPSEPTPVETTPARRSVKLTVAGALDKYEAHRKQKGERIKNLPEQLRHLRRSLEPWAEMPVEEFSKADLKEARDLIAERGSLGSSNKLLSYAQTWLKWCSQEDHIPFNFAPDVVRLGANTARDRFLSDEEIALFWEATHGSNAASMAAFCRLARFLLVTGQRRSEAAEMAWRDVKDKTWHQSDNKASRPHDVHLTPLALSLMGPRVKDGMPFTGVSGRLSGWSKLKPALDARCKIEEPWTLHDLRRTFASGLMRLNVDREVIAGCLNHAQPGVTSVYMRDKLEGPKREAWQAWSDHIESLVACPWLVR